MKSINGNFIKAEVAERTEVCYNIYTEVERAAKIAVQVERYVYGIDTSF